VDEVVGEQR